MYDLLINSNKSVSLSQQQFTLLKVINELGFLNFNQLTLLWSIVNKTYINFSHSNLRKWIQKYKLLNKYVPNKHRTMDVLHPVYHVSSTGIRLLKKYHVDYVPLKYLKVNAHNEQCNEVTLQALFSLTFDVDLINDSKIQPLRPNINYLISSPSFSLDKLDLRSFQKQVTNSDRYSFVPDQMISCYNGHQRKEIFIELDNRTEDNKVQIRKIIQYIFYAQQNPHTQILMVIASTDGSLPTRRIKKFTNIYRRINNLLKKFADYKIYNNSHQYSLAQIYLKTNNLVITVAGVSEAYVDIADFISDKNKLDFTKRATASLTETINNKFNKTIAFKIYKNLNHDWMNLSNKPIGFLQYSTNPTVYQPIIWEYEHSLDAYLGLQKAVKKKEIILYPIRNNKALNAPGIPEYYKNHSFRNIVSPAQAMCYQPTITKNINPNLIVELTYLKYHYAKYIFSFFKTGKISLADKTIYHHFTYFRSTPLAIKIANIYLKYFNLSVSNKDTDSFDELHQLAEKLSCKEFIDRLSIQSIPIEVINAILNRIGIRAYSSPFLELTSFSKDFNHFDYLYFPNDINPHQRTNVIRF